MTRPIYLDANATHPLLPGVRRSLARMLAENNEWANASSTQHSLGRRSREALLAFKDALSDSLDPKRTGEWILVSGATEALNAALKGRALALEGRPLRYLTTPVEHAAVLETLRQTAGDEILLGRVNAQGALDADAFIDQAARLSQGAEVIVALQGGNNETGALFDLETLLPRLRQSVPSATIVLDLAQAWGKLSDARLRIWLQHADAAAFSGHKIGGPMGIGLLFKKRSLELKPLLQGGSQEGGLRPGTTNVWGFLGLHAALNEWREEGDSHRARLLELRKVLLKALSGLPKVCVRDVGEGLPNVLSLRVKGCRSDVLLPSLDMAGFAVSSGSACASGALKASHVLLAMGVPREEALETVRVSWSVLNSEEELQGFARALGKIAAGGQ